MIKLKHYSTLPPKGFSRIECNKELSDFSKKLFELQNIFYADSRFALLIILQGTDTSGKDGTIRHVMSCMNPMGVNVKSFKKPTEEEKKHDFLWRIYDHFPSKGMIEVFNRSYYEDIIVPLIDKKISKTELLHRYKLFNILEKHLKLSGIHVLKFFLHISKDQQVKRIQQRFSLPHKRWKYSKEDEKSAEKWADYQVAHEAIINNCNDNKWIIIPSDKKWYRNYAVSKIITNHLESLHLNYPES